MGGTAGHMPAGEQEAENRGSAEGAGQRWAAERTLRDSTNLIGFEYRYFDNATLFDDTRNRSPLLTSGLGGIRPTSDIFFNRASRSARAMEPSRPNLIL